MASLLLVGCAATPPAPADGAPKSELVYRTGSNIPVRDVQPMTKEEREKQAADAQATLQGMQRTGAGVPKK